MVQFNKVEYIINVLVGIQYHKHILHSGVLYNSNKLI